MRGEIINKKPILFLDDWPQQVKDLGHDEFEAPGMNDIKRWRIQTLLARNPYGIPSLDFVARYKEMFGKELDLNEMGYDTLWDMVSQLPDVFAVQEPDDLTEILFPENPCDKILCDARLGYDFTRLQSDSPTRKNDPEILNIYAWFNRDEDFPADVVLAGEQYGESILPMTEASIPGTRGVHKALLISVASPNHFFVNIESQHLDRIHRLSVEVKHYFKSCGEPIERFKLPNEFVQPGFSCLVFLQSEQSWERCSIVSRCRGKILVETVDYGGTYSVDQSCLHLMPKQFFDIPKQAVLLSLIGLKPYHGGDKWSVTAGGRMRNFSNVHYVLDVLLLEPLKSKESKSNELEVMGLPISPDKSGKKKKAKSWQAKIQFEAIVCDRNDEDMDLFLDQVLIMETYAKADEKIYDELVEPLRTEFKKALANLPRPVNPLNAIEIE